MSEQVYVVDVDMRLKNDSLMIIVQTERGSYHIKKGKYEIIIPPHDRHMVRDMVLSATNLLSLFKKLDVSLKEQKYMGDTATIMLVKYLCKDTNWTWKIHQIFS